jgi:hypothetical protein
MTKIAGSGSVSHRHGSAWNYYSSGYVGRPQSANYNGYAHGCQFWCGRAQGGRGSQSGQLTCRFGPISQGASPLKVLK